MSLRWVLFDWGDTLMREDGPADLPMALWPEVQAVAGAAEVLAQLTGRYRVGIATNAAISDRPMIECALARASLLAYISELFTFRELGVRKAEPAFWEAVVGRLGVGRDELLMIGDDLAQDVKGPRACGIAAIWFNWKRAPGLAGPDVPVIERLSELPALLERPRR